MGVRKEYATRTGEADRLRESDESLLARACAGEGAAFHELADRHAERLFRLAFRLVGEVQAAEDVVQNTLLGAFRGMRAFEGRSTVKTWLSSILSRQAARYHRSRARRTAISLEEGGAGRDDAAGALASEDADRRMDVHEALRQLSPEHREIVVLREFEGMSYAEMAAALGVPQGTVESRLHRARQDLKTMLRGYLP